MVDGGKNVYFLISGMSPDLGLTFHDTLWEDVEVEIFPGLRVSQEMVFCYLLHHSHFFCIYCMMMGVRRTEASYCHYHDCYSWFSVISSVSCKQL